MAHLQIKPALKEIIQSYISGVVDGKGKTLIGSSFTKSWRIEKQYLVNITGYPGWYTHTVTT